jgi:putative FmdB family regulatory protein
MPIYEYVCNACGHEFEEWQKISDAPVRTCPTCGKRKVERLVSLSAFHLKGTGWYVTDYAGKKAGSEPARKEKAEEKGEKKESQGEKTAKPASKPSKSDE